ncbi:4-hydroxy-tetrahydrodipicolinate reductase [Devriesea agamarum]|uniref:4-hydroxy-tetrahydrodipicolinate reductase n=1 Tax=Devriesea agamarum TaxID=472569 RepID=UPI00071D4F3E|nr:4-hydroxy-tetrahydrodipicolinate reductase [Devriesea agamarum]
MTRGSLSVAVFGSDGRMGSETVRAIESADDIDLVARVSVPEERHLAADNGAQVMVDFTIPSETKANVLWAIEHGIHAVVGTTGWTEDDLADVHEALEKRPGVGVLIAPNFALGAVLAMRFSEIAAKYYESAEVIELHHPQKVDAPSGTARHTAQGIAQARRNAGLDPVPDATASGLDGARGAMVDGIHVHAVRLRGLVAHQEVLFGAPGEQLTIRHDSFDRVSFMPGVLLAVREVGSRPGLTVGLDQYMDLG